MIELFLDSPIELQALLSFLIAVIIWITIKGDK